MTHNHGASVSGYSSEQNIKKLLSLVGLSLLKTKKEFNIYYTSRGYTKRYAETAYKTKIQLSYPSALQTFNNAKSSTGKPKRFFSDGYIPEIDTILEVKFHNQLGTTDLKIHAEFFKIENGVYENNKIVYICYGPAIERSLHFEAFQRKCKNYDPSETKVKVFWEKSCANAIDYLAGQYDTTKEKINNVAV